MIAADVGFPATVGGTRLRLEWLGGERHSPPFLFYEKLKGHRSRGMFEYGLVAPL